MAFFLLMAFAVVGNAVVMWIIYKHKVVLRCLSSLFSHNLPLCL